MSIKLVDRVLEHSRQSGSALLVLIVLADWANDGGYCYPSIASISRKTRLSDRYTRRIIQKLIEDGDLKVEIGMGVPTKNGPTNLFIVTTPDRDGWDGELDAASPSKPDGVDHRPPVQDETGGLQVPPVTGGRGAYRPSDPLEEEPLEDNTALALPTTPRRAKNLAFDTVKRVFALDNAGVIQLHVSMLTGKDTKKNTAWNACRIQPGLDAYEISEFGQWMNEQAASRNLHVPRKPETIAQWVSDWRRATKESIESDALARSMMTYTDEHGDPYRNPDVQFWIKVINGERAERAARWKSENER